MADERRKQMCERTGMVKKMDPRLGELAPTTIGSQDAESRNLEPIFLTIPVFRD